MNTLYLLAIILGISGQSIVKKPYTQKTNGAGVYFFNTLLSAAALLFFVVTSSKFSFDISFIPYSIGFAVSYAVASVFMVLAIAYGSLSLTSLFISYSLMIPTFYGLMIGDPIGKGFIPGMILLVISLFLTNKMDEKGKISFKWIMFVILSFVGNGMCTVVQKMQQMESSWTRHEDIEIMAEGDVFPRPRINCPASFLEGFDTAIRASGCTDGILKYGIDYTSNADYETGYAKFHERNLGIYADIDRVFDDKESCGVRVYESMKKVSDMVVPTKVNNSVNIEDLFFSKAARTLVCNSIPTVYEGDGVCGIVFDENARNLPLSALKNGVILDIAAAEILMDRGIDVGLKKINSLLDDNNSSIVVGKEEHFIDNDNYISIIGATVYDIEINEKAEVLSDMHTSKGEIPVSYRYENADGNRFLVLNVNTRYNDSSILKHYERGRQIEKNIPWLSGAKLPAYVYGNPSLYMQTKEKDGAMAVGLWNFFADTAIDPVVELGKDYSDIKFINCEGQLNGNKVYLNNISPFAFVGFEVK